MPKPATIFGVTSSAGAPAAGRHKAIEVENPSTSTKGVYVTFLQHTHATADMYLGVFTSTVIGTATTQADDVNNVFARPDSGVNAVWSWGDISTANLNTIYDGLSVARNSSRTFDPPIVVLPGQFFVAAIENAAEGAVIFGTFLEE